MSTIRAAGLMFRITPFIDPTRWSLVPKSVVSVMMGSAKDSLRFRRRSRMKERALGASRLLQPIEGQLACQGSVPEWLRHKFHTLQPVGFDFCSKRKYTGLKPVLQST